MLKALHTVQLLNITTVSLARSPIKHYSAGEYNTSDTKLARPRVEILRQPSACGVWQKKKKKKENVSPTSSSHRKSQQWDVIQRNIFRSVSNELVALVTCVVRDAIRPEILKWVCTASAAFLQRMFLVTRTTVNKKIARTQWSQFSKWQNDRTDAVLALKDAARSDGMSTTGNSYLMKQVYTHGYVCIRDTYTVDGEWKTRMRHEQHKHDIAVFEN